MPRSPLLAASLAGCALIAGCAGPQATKGIAGLTYQCGTRGEARIVFNDGGYIPEERVWGKDEKGQPARVLRSTAELHFDGRSYPLVAEHAAEGLRYRSAAGSEAGPSIIWSSASVEGSGGAEDAVIRIGAAGAEEAIACRRSGRADRDASADMDHAEDGHGEPKRGAEDPHRR